VFKARCISALLLCSTAATAATPTALFPDDPMRPPATKAMSSTAPSGTRQRREALQLNAVRITDQQRSAIINGQRVAEGERVGTARVVSIESASVTLERTGSRFTLNLLPSTFKRPTGVQQP